jgi:predicted metalloprotease with PDZ domain
MMAGCASQPHVGGSELVRTGESSIRVEMDAKLPVSHDAIVEWVRRGAAAVSTYLGRFPVKHLVLRVHGGGEEAVGEGVTHGSMSIDVTLGRNAQEADLKGDWVLTHEMFHLAFPTLDDRRLWMMEGLSDYLEPVARARAGQWSAKDVWLEFVQGLPQGLPGPGEGGLDGSRRRERIYWGGNIYWLLADVQIRIRTDNRRGLEDVIRTILNQGGTGGEDWPLERVLATGDEATGTTVLADLYKMLGQQRGDVDLDELWKKLGVRVSGDAVVFDDTARWAKYRVAITARAKAVP